MDGLPVPPEFQLVVAGAIGVLAVIGWVVTFLRRLKDPSGGQPGLSRSDLTILGAGLSDREALERVREELRELRAAVEDVAVAIRGIPVALPRRRR